MTDILIRAKRETVEHKMREVIDKHNSQLELGEDDPDWESDFCYWTLSRLPKKKNIKKVLFTDGKIVFAEGKFLMISSDAVEFDALERVNYPQPKQAPTRGFTYVN